MKKLENKVAVVTGGNSGIGLATAQEFIAQGANVVITGRNAEALHQAALKLGEKAYPITSDTSKLSDIEQLVKKVADRFGKIDVLFINAGIAKFLPLEQVTEESFDETFDINIKGAYFTIQKLSPLMKQGGSIILNSSVVTHVGMANSSVYSASKAALTTLAKSLSAELLPKGIRVNVVSPGPIATPIYDKMGLTQEQQQQFAQYMIPNVPMKRFGSPEEIAKVATFFASDDSSYISGIDILADGGIHIHAL
jgi:NAD(P)-dependent dehydrogenase (short-subunit alcohol dehydrogenase family)